VATVVAVALLSACADASKGQVITTDSAPPVTICSPDTTPQAEADLPAVASIDQAVAALTQQLGAPPSFFEINATARVVNMFVALNGGTKVPDGKVLSVDPV
jgi:hypothetical protein